MAVKPTKNSKSTPEEALRRACEEEMGLNLTYNQIRDRLDTAELARVGQVRQASAKAVKTPTPASRRSAVATVLLVLTVLILTPALAVGSFLIARSAMEPTPPAETGHRDPSGTDPLQGLIPGRPMDSETTVVTPRPIPPNTAGEDWGNLFNLSRSYATDMGLLLRAEHLDPRATDGTLPAVMTVSELAEWKSFFGEVYSDGVPSQELLDALNGLTWDFFAENSLLVVITEGRSGSIRYRPDSVHASIDTLTLELTAEVPPALTLDVVHWCVVIPVTKAAAAMPLELVLRDEPTASVETEPSDPPDVRDPNKLWFGSLSYVRDNCLIGQESYNREGTYPRTQTVTTYAAWQELYGGCSPCYDEDFLPRLEALDEAFFAEKSLLILHWEEGSGSRRHLVEEVAERDGMLYVTVTTLFPEIETADMAYWVILIPIDKAYADLPVEIVTQQKPELPHVQIGSGYLYGDIIHAHILNGEVLDGYFLPKGQTVDSVTAYHAAVLPVEDSEMPAELQKAMNSFDETFFKEKSLLILYLENEPDAVHYEIDSLTVLNGRLQVGVYSVYPKEGDGPSLQGPGYRVVLVPVDKGYSNLPISVCTLK